MRFHNVFLAFVGGMFLVACSGSGSGTGTVSDTTSPTTPTGLSATSVSDTEIDLAWTASIDAVGVTGYYVYQDGDTTTPVATVNGSGYTVPGLAPDTAYEFNVSAFDAAGNDSALSNMAAATTLLAPVANNDTATVTVGETVVIDVLSNDTDDGTLDPATVVPTNPTAGTLSVNPATGAISYTHDGSAPGTDSFTYVVNDDDGLSSNAATVTITVEAAAPAIPVSGLVLHLEADSGVSSTGSTVMGWADQSPQGNDLIGAGDPQLLPGALNGAPVIDFDGTGDKLERTALLNGLPAGGADRTAYVVINYLSTGFGGFAYGTGFGPPDTCNQTFGLVVNQQGRLTVQGWCDDFDSGIDGTGQGWLVQSVSVSGGEVRHFLNGNMVDSRAHVYNTVLSNIVIGAEIDSDPFLTMQIAAVIVYDRALSTAEQTQVDAYLQTKYFNSGGGGQPNAPVLSAIGDQTVREGDTLTLNLSASDTDVGDTLAFSVNPNLPYGVFTDNGNRTATWVLTPGPGDAGLTAVTITVTDNGTPSQMDAELFDLDVVDANAVAVTGTIKDADTLQPIENAIVSLQSTATQTTTAVDGSFTLNLSTGVDVTVVGAGEGYYSASKKATSPASDIEILLKPVEIGTNAAYTFVQPSTCGVCHPDQETEWENSAMAAAGINTWVHDIYDGSGTPGGMGGFVYTRDSAFAGSNPDSECAACHQPESWITAGYSGRMEGPDDAGYPSIASTHGVSCDTCHKVANVDTQKIDFPGIFPGAVTFNLPEDGTQVQYGGLPDVDFEWPGAMQASYQPHLESELCGACHQDKNDINEDHTFAGVISEPTYTEWEESPYGDEASPLYQTCIDCHMPPTGATQFCTHSDFDRDPAQIRSHAIEGTTPTYLENAVDLVMQTQVAGNNLTVDVTINNSLTGHHVPTGVTVRNMILVVEAWQDGEDPLVNPLVHTGTQTIHDLGGIGDPAQGYFAGLPGKFFAKHNLNASLQGPTFFTDATSILFDTRIPALGTDQTSYSFTLPAGSGTIHVRSRLIYRRGFRFLVDAKSWTEDGHGNPLADVASPHYGHLMEEATKDVAY